MSSRLINIIVLLLFCISSKSIAADISGQVITAEGQPVCALVLASGRSMFSCNPIGQFSLTGLPLEPDGSVNLQVYAEGFYPYLRNITQFGSQPAVIMPAAGSCPVDDGLSGGSLSGTYHLIRYTEHYNDDTFIDSSGTNGLSVVGTLVVAANVITVQLTATYEGQTVESFQTGGYSDSGFYFTWYPTNGGQRQSASIIEKGNKLIVEFNNNAIGTDYVELTQWVKISDEALPIQSSTVFALEQAAPSNFSGIGVGQLIDSMGIRQLLLDKSMKRNP